MEKKHISCRMARQIVLVVQFFFCSGFVGNAPYWSNGGLSTHKKFPDKWRMNRQENDWKYRYHFFALWAFDFAQHLDCVRRPPSSCLLILSRHSVRPSGKELLPSWFHEIRCSPGHVRRRWLASNQTRSQCHRSRLIWSSCTVASAEESPLLASTLGEVKRWCR